MLTQDSKLVEAIFKLSRAMKEGMSFDQDLVHLTVLQLQTLIFLKKQKSVPMTELARQFKIELPSATSLINKLAKAKLILRKTDNQDRRVIKISLSKQGVILLQKAMQERERKIQINLAYLSCKDKQNLLVILEKIIDRIDKKYEV